MRITHGFRLDKLNLRMKRFLKKYSLIIYLIQLIKRIAHKLNFYKNLKKSREIKIVVGSAGIYESGWIPTYMDMLNVLKRSDWNNYFRPGSIDAILAEYVWEHLSMEEGIIAAKNCYHFLKKDGYLRVTVPYGFHPDPSYVDYVKINGTGPGSEDHKVLYTYKTFSKIFTQAGFKLELLEYFDENGQFRFINWDPDNGLIHRSKRFDTRNKNGNLNYTSIILDAIK